MVKFCPKCGKKIKEGTFCNNCNIEELIVKIKDINVRYCEECSRYQLKNTWKNYDEELIPYIETAKYSIKTLENVKLDIKPFYKGHKIKKLKITATDKNNFQEIELPITIDKTMCKSCSKKEAKYLEGTLQIRNFNETVFEFLNEELNKAEEEHVHVTKMTEGKDSIDLEMTSQKHIARIAKSIQKQFGGELKIDYKLHTRSKQTQKELFRITATVLLPKVLKGETIEFDEKPYLVKSLDKDIHAMNLITGKKEKIKFTDKYLKLETKITTISAIRPYIQALDPETFQSEPLVIYEELFKHKKLKIGQEIKVLSYKNGLYLIQIK